MKKTHLRSRGTSTIDRRISNFVKKFGIARVNYGERFYYKTNGEIQYTAYRAKGDDDLIEWIYDNYGITIEPYLFMFSLLHEVGHHMTVGNFSEEDLATEMVLREHFIPNLKNPNDLYFELPTEKAATMWALNYLNENFDECWDFQAKIFEKMKHTLKKKSFRV